MKYNEYKNPDYAQLAEQVLAFWKQNRVFEASVDSREGKPSFTFFEGPPSANGAPGIHHVMARAVKDVFCRYKTLKGFQVKRKGGWDTHGLPIELQVEKELGITKEDIGKKISVEEYNQKCRESVMKFTDQWNDLTEKMGYWVDLDKPYVTYQPDYIESIWFLLKELYKKDLLYKGYTIQPYSPAAGTGLSSHELNQPGCYRMVKDTSVVAQFKAKNNALFKEEWGETFFLAWTTTPWTLPANAALAVGKNIDYVAVKTFNPYTFLPVTVVLAKALMGKYFSEKAKEVAFADFKAGDKLIPFEVVAEWKGSQLIGSEYEQLMPFVQPEKSAFRVINGDFVSTEDGTGIVHIAPTFGSDDFRAAAQADIPAILVTDDEGNRAPIVDKQGRYVKEITKYAGMYVKNEYYAADQAPEKSLDVLISIQLKEENRAFKVEKYEHSYPHCWRTDKPVLYYPLDSWFIRTTAYKEQLIELNKTINWKPASTGSGRFGNWLENLVDWNLSRSRYWGTPLPIWRSADGKEEVCIGSTQELLQELNAAAASGLLSESQKAQNTDYVAKLQAGTHDLHRPFVDQIWLVRGGQVLQRETDLIDVWFDSGAMPYAQWHYPFENQEVFASNYPADFIAEGVDQTRGWFFTLHAIAVMLFDKVAFKNVIANGLVLDKNGNKMSKRLGNAIDPFATLKQYGPDATRWYMIANAPPWDNLKFNLDGVQETQRKFFGTLQNTYSFFALYANLDGFAFAEAAVPLADRTESDRWIISKLNTLIASVEQALDDYDPTRAARVMQDFVNDDLSNWYVRLNRKRFWKGEYNTDKIAAYQTLYTCLETLAKLISPIAPFYAERLFQDLNAVTKRETVTSVHLSDYPVLDKTAIDADLEARMALAQNISSLIHSLRKKHSLKVRQPLLRVLIPVLNEKFKADVQAVEELILSEVNIKAIEYIDDTSGVVVKKIKPNFKKLGKTFGAQMQEVAGLVKDFDQDKIREIEQKGQISLQLSDKVVSLTLEDVEITSEDIPGWIVASENGVTVALDITLTDELKQEGIARDVVNRVQNLRKDMGLDVQAKIRITVQDNADALVIAALQSNQVYICTETQAVELVISAAVPNATAVDMDDFTLQMLVQEV